jgi:YD repeat-containing protein
VAAQSEYDTYGKRTAAIDELGNRAEFIYDAAYHRFPVEARNPLYSAGDTRHKTTTAWDPLCGLPTAVTDLDGQVTAITYDALCRETRTDTPGGNFAITDYVNLGDPAAQYVEVQAPPADGSGNLWSRSYLDGLGRPYQSLTKGPGVGQEIQSDTAFNERGQAASQSAPYYLGDTPQVTAFDYDGLDRATEVEHPDLNTVQSAYGIGDTFSSVTTTAWTAPRSRPITATT